MSANPPPVPPLPPLPPGVGNIFGRISLAVELAQAILDLIGITQNLIAGPPDTSLEQRMQRLQFAVDGIAADLSIATGYCGKAGQSVAAGVGQPHVRIRELTVGGTG